MHSWPSPAIPSLPADQPGLPDRLTVHDTRSQGPIELPTDGRRASMYVCGITPYDATHLGHAFTYLIFDLVNRTWRDLGIEVTYAQNVTDVDEPLLERAAETGADWEELAEEQTALFRSDMTALRLLAPDHFVAATDAMDDVAELVERLKADGHVYAIDDDEFPDLYFRCSSMPDFGAVSHLDRDAMLAEFAAKGGDPERPGKIDALDALVWRFERDGEPSWVTSLGRGRPGWHIECTAIALSRLGTTMTLQGGGVDLVFPHHEMSAVQGLAATEQPFALAYVHGGMVGLDGEKMSKSLGNLEMVSRLLGQGTHPMVIRLALLSQHYRRDWEWTPALLGDAQRRFDAWRLAATAKHGPSAEPTLSLVRTALRTDLDAPQALRIIDEWTAAALAGDGDDAEAPAIIAAAADALLGVDLLG